MFDEVSLNRVWCAVRAITVHSYGNIIPCITAGSYPPISIDLGKDEPGMTLQREVKRDQWIDYLVNNKPVKSPVDLDALPAGKYRLKS